MPFLPWTATSSGGGQQPWQFRPETYGAKGDGAVALVSVTSGSAIISTTPIAAPAAPTLSNAGSGGSLTAGTYQVQVTFVNQWGETVASAASSIAIAGAQSLAITSPTPTWDATGWYAYVTQAGGSTFIRQQATPTPIGAGLTLTVNPVSAGPGLPGANTTATQAFTSTAIDGGKNIMVCGGLGVPGSPYIGTIASVQSPTQATLADTAMANTVTGAAMVFSSDDRLAFDACVTAAKAYALAHSYKCEIVLSDKIYGLGSGLFQSTATGATGPGLSYNTQLRIPVPNQSGQTRKLEFSITGPGDNAHAYFWVSALPNLNGASIVSYTIGPASADPTFGQQSVIGSPTGGTNFNGSNAFGNTKVVIRGVQVVTAGWCNTLGIDIQWAGGCRLNGSSQAFAPATSTGGGVNPSNAWIGNASFQSTIGAGVQLPNLSNNDDIVVESWSVEGMRNGILSQADHVTITRLLTINDYVGIGVTLANANTHALTVSQWSSENTTFALNNINLSSGHILCDITMDGENAGATDVRDGSPGAFYGIIQWDDPFRTGATPTIVGGANLKIINHQLAPGHQASPPAVPASGSSAALVYRDAQVKVTTGAGVTVSAVTVDGTATGQTVAASSTLYPVSVPSGKTIALTYAGGTPTWDWWLN